MRRGLGIRYEGVDALQKFVTTFVRSRAPRGHRRPRPRLDVLDVRPQDGLADRRRRRGTVAQPRRVPPGPRHRGRGPRAAPAGDRGRRRGARCARRVCAGPAAGSSPGGTARGGCSSRATPPTSGSPSAASA
ncbi:hypothetical protein AB7952_00335 [Streptomyces sp. PG2]